MTTVERKGKIIIQIRHPPFLLFVGTSILIHSVGLLSLVLSNRNLSDLSQETESTPIDFVIVSPEVPPEEPPPDTERRSIKNSIAKGKKVESELPSATNKIGNEEAIATSEANQKIPTDVKNKPSASVISRPPVASVKPIPPLVSKPQPREESPFTVQPPTSLSKVPKPKISSSTSIPATTPPVEQIKPISPVSSKPQPREESQHLSESNSTASPLLKPLPQSEKTPSRETDSASVATNLSPKPQALEPSSSLTQPLSVPETKPNLSSESTKTPVSSSAASLLGGTQSRSLSEDSGSSFFNPQANASQQALNSGGLDARKDLNLGPYLAEIRRRVRRNWNPSQPSQNRHTILAFAIQRNGQITALRIIQSSGSKTSDSESLEAVQKSAPFAALPPNFPRQQLKVKFNFNIFFN